MRKLGNTIYAFFIIVVTSAIAAPIVIGLYILSEKYKSVTVFAGIIAGLICYAYIKVLFDVLREIFRDDEEDKKDKPTIVYHHGFDEPRPVYYHNFKDPGQACQWTPWDKGKVYHKLKESSDGYIYNLENRFVKVLERTGIDQVHTDMRHKLSLMFSYLNSIVDEKYNMTDVDFFKAWTLGRIAVLISLPVKDGPQQYAYNFDYEAFVTSEDSEDTRFVIVVDEDGSLSYTAGLKEELINIYDLRRNLNW
jgi:hypothetical protein|nr:MAG TPA: hypothetical protein [Caudoviricetes sp.]